MRKDEIIEKLKLNHWFFEDKDGQIIVRIGRKYNLILNEINGFITYEDLMKSSVFFRKNVSLKVEFRYVIISIIVLILTSVLMNYIEEAPAFQINVMFVITLFYCIWEIYRLIYCFKCLNKIKKLLNLS